MPTVLISIKYKYRKSIKILAKIKYFVVLFSRSLFLIQKQPWFDWKQLFVSLDCKCSIEIVAEFVDK